MKTTINLPVLALGFASLLLANSCCLAATARLQGHIKDADTRNVNSKYLNCLLRQNDQIKASHRDSADNSNNKNQSVDFRKIIGCSSDALVVDDRSHEIHDKSVSVPARKIFYSKNCCQEDRPKNNTASHDRAAVEFSQAAPPFIANGIYPYGL